MSPDPSSAQFNRFERVLIVATDARRNPYAGQSGTILWRDALPARDGGAQAGQWMYVVYLPASDCCRTFLQSDLQSMGTFDAESSHLGLRAEISFDLVMDEDMPFIEGTYRLPAKFWEVVIFSKGKVTNRECKASQWRSGITGIVFIVPPTEKLSRAYAVRAMSNVFAHTNWVEVQGPDSMMLR